MSLQVGVQNTCDRLQAETGFTTTSKRSRADAVCLHVAPASFEAPLPEEPLPGFRHFLATPRDHQRFRIGAEAPHSSEAASRSCRTLLSRLAARMTVPYRWPSQAHEPCWENPGLPSGYTYLLQLVAHDLVQTSLPLSTLETSTGVRNTRTSRLRLDTIYGGGPLVCPLNYAPDGETDQSRTKLRLGRMRAAPGETGPFRDIARVAAENVTGVQRAGRTDVLVADPRNDDHAIVAQLTAMFHLLHNAIVDRLPVDRAVQSSLQAAYDRFQAARAAVTLIYRSVIRRDLLPRILHPAVRPNYETENPRFIERGARGNDWRVPVEFSHAAFRFGHAMVRNQYRMNEKSSFDISSTLRRTSAHEPLNMPLDAPWIVQWGQFFEIRGSRPNLSRRIGPEYSPGLLDEDLFSAIDETGRLGLGYRDLMSSSRLGLWSVQALVDALREQCPEIVGSSRLLSDAGYRSSVIADWLSDGAGAAGLTPGDVQALSTNPPLQFFVLFEAAHEGGATLGRLGSLIVGDVIARALTVDRLPGETFDLRQSLANVGRTFFGRNEFEWAEDIGDVEALVLFTARLAGLETAQPAFV